MACPLCRGPILASEDYTVRACCQVKYHAGCMHRRYVSGPRACPKCGKEPSLRFDDAPGAIASTLPRGEESAGGMLASLGRAIRSLNQAPERAQVDRSLSELLDEGYTWQDMFDDGMTKKSLVEAGLDKATAIKHSRQLKAVFDFDRSDRDGLK